MTPPLTDCWPADFEQALLVGRLWQPGLGPVLVAATQNGLMDLSALAPTCSALLDLPQVAQRVRAHLASGQAANLGPADVVIANSDEAHRDNSQPWLLACRRARLER